MNVRCNSPWNTDGRALVIFTGDTDLKALKCLKTGFRHCCVLIEIGDHWLFFDPNTRSTDMTIYDRLDLVETAAWFLEQGDTVVCCRISRPRRRRPLVRPLTCVEAVKGVLGIRAPMVFTPWQLFKYLTTNIQENRNFPKI